MKRWMKRTLFGLMGATIVVGSLSACGHHGHHQGMAMSAQDQADMRAKIVSRVGSKLDLTDEQKKHLGALTDKMQEQRVALMGQTTDPRADLKALIAGDKFDKARAQALITEKTAALNTKSPEVVAAMGTFFDSLSPAQQTKVREYLQGGHRWWHRG